MCIIHVQFTLSFRDIYVSKIFTFSAAVCIHTATSQGATFNTTQISSIQTAILNGYLTNTRPSDSVIVDIGFGVKHITKLVWINSCFNYFIVKGVKKVRSALYHMI